MKYSVIVPIYRNEASIPRLLQALSAINDSLDDGIEAVFVVDGSPDRSYAILHEALAGLAFPAQLLAHSRNFGSFPAIRSGLQAARGDHFAVMAADLQEPPELVTTFFRMLGADECDVVVGTRTGRQNDPWSSRMASAVFWGLYRRLVVPEMPPGGVDIFGCNRVFRDQLLQLEESRSSLIALIFWLGFRRKQVGYERLARQEGRSAWTLGKKIDYMMDNVFAFTDFPIRLLIKVGAGGAAVSGLAGLVVLIARLTGSIRVPGYAPTMLAVLFLGAVNLFGLGLVGTYAWRAYENSKRRPLAVIAKQHQNDRGQ
ncbi:glycosyl transferase [Dyella thiooxydans]|uniref:Glycosyl transferase n=1 Tax=Dyella thiooxydans TaxID=445710 RepID=A0A161JDF0_9GAMM|nr:glycosyltransferase family 2 protein [Dyella thiooxydans]AND71055.1 glycosyl transferase [Dyella thiooxydans]